jgi:ABC-type transport system involved in multi-copper enzyme maturation permease subunit
MTGILLSVIIGGNLIARDIQSRTIYSVVTLPISRSRYILEKYLGLALLIACAQWILGAVNYCGLWVMAGNYPPEKPFIWLNYFVCLLFDLEKLLVLSSVLVLFSSIATSTFLPIFLTLSVYAVGITTEKVKYFLDTVKEGRDIFPLVQIMAKGAYYIFPNLSPFDLKLQTIYSMPLDISTLGFTFVYGIGYIAVMLVIACAVFEKRDFI